MKRLSAFVVAAFLMITSSFVLAAEKASSDQPQDVAIIQQSININTADLDALTQLKGIGAKKAEAIIAWREANGGFKSIDQLLEIKGIGESTLEANREKIQI
jgi:competence protein ComEA